MRVIEVLTLGGWKVTPFEDLQVGDRFRIYDGDVQFIDSCGNIEWTVKEAPVATENGVLYVKTEEDVD